MRLPPLRNISDGDDSSLPRMSSLRAKQPNVPTGDTAVAELEAGLAKLPTDATLIRAEFRDRIARSEEARGDSAAAEHHTTAARELRGRLDHSFTARSYRTLYDSLRDRRVQLVASQYPGRSIDEVKEMLDGAPDVVFVDNAASFREAIDRHGFWRVYEDEFAGDFGHMTELGKEILARRVADGVRAARAPVLSPQR